MKLLTDNNTALNIVTGFRDTIPVSLSAPTLTPGARGTRYYNFTSDSYIEPASGCVHTPDVTRIFTDRADDSYLALVSQGASEANSAVRSQKQQLPNGLAFDLRHTITCIKGWTQ